MAQSIFSPASSCLSLDSSVRDVRAVAGSEVNSKLHPFSDGTLIMKCVELTIVSLSGM